MAQAVVVIVILVLCADICYWTYQRFWHSDFRISVIDVGHGGASLLELPRGHTILIDGGGFADNSAFDVGERIIAPFLWRKKIRTIDTMILSHPNSDHLNGLIYIAEHFNVKKLLTNNETRDTVGYRQLMEVVSEHDISLPAYAEMERFKRINGVNLSFLYPPRDFLERRKTDKWRNSNNNSLVVKASFESTSFLFPGDIMAAAEEELVRLAGNELTATVLVAPHHGSRSSSSESFLSAVKPEVVIISSSHNRRFNFPHPAVVKRYENRGCTIYRTEINGAVHMATDGRHLEIQPFIALDNSARLREDHKASVLADSDSRLGDFKRAVVK